LDCPKPIGLLDLGALASLADFGSVLGGAFAAIAAAVQVTTLLAFNGVMPTRHAANMRPTLSGTGRATAPSRFIKADSSCVPMTKTCRRTTAETFLPFCDSLGRHSWPTALAAVAIQAAALAMSRHLVTFEARHRSKIKCFPGVVTMGKILTLCLDRPTATNGAYFKFDQGSAAQLSDLLRAVAAFAVGGIKALEAQGETAQLLLKQLR
jgi:hypothetical protein